MKVDILHDYLNQQGGGEKVLMAFTEMHPDSTIYTLFKTIKFPSKVRTSIFQLFPLKNYYKYLFPLFPLFLMTLKPKKKIILSSSHSFIKNISKPKSSIHFCYCHTPMRWAWSLTEEYMKNESALIKPFITIFLGWFRDWDKKQSKNVNHFIANSKTVQHRIKKYYNRDSTVIYPPVDTDFFNTDYNEKKNYFLVVSRLIEYKKIDLAIRAFKEMNEKLIVVGTGRDEKKLHKLAEGCPNIVFKGRVSNKNLRKYYRGAKALVFPQWEDFGITSGEAQACGTPVIAFGKGGALETVIDGKTGMFFYKQTADSLKKAVLEFKTKEFSRRDCRTNAERFDTKIFKKNIKRFIETHL